MWKNSFLPFLLVLTPLAGLVQGCAGSAVDSNDPAALYKEAEQDIENDRYQLAIDKLRIVRNKFPYSNYAVEAQLKIADVFFLQESFGEAAVAYEAFRDLHPKNERVPYAMFRTGLSYYNDAPGNLARDQTSAQKALDAFNEYLKLFTNAPEAAEVREKANLSRQTLANKELYIGNFYLKQDDYDAARNRFTRLIAAYPETEAASTAKERLAKIADRKTEGKKRKVEATPSGGPAGT